ncbi:NlpC/P60 family protein [Kitasatospora sp. NPDC049285]|uniref:C40 family peptidase n=1 Tax=Kitasatospora sp. NPDC049285 TaxID=3157096 RepID=UPI00342AEC09
MASHRRPRTATARRRLRIGALASVTALAPAPLAAAAPAEPPPGPQQTRARLDALYREAEEATQRYDGTRERIAELRTRVSLLQDELARRTDAAEAVRTRLGALAAEQYRTGGLPAALRLALDDDPQRFLEHSASLDRVGALELAALQQYGQQRAGLTSRAAEARADLTELAEQERQLAEEKAAVQQRLHEARTLLSALGDPADAPGRAGPPQPAPNGRAAAALAFARAQLGKPYVWGATGPDSYDCSGLTQAAWRAAGVKLPRTTYAQIAAAPRITRDRLLPGDLVFFYSGVSHVGLYTGGGRMIHAPHPGAPVRYESIDVMPFAGAVRPG